MSDDTLQWVIPAVTLGYAVRQDPYGRFHFFTENVDIMYRDGVWLAVDIFKVSEVRRYSFLKDALESEYDDFSKEKEGGLQKNIASGGR